MTSSAGLSAPGVRTAARVARPRCGASQHAGLLARALRALLASTLLVLLAPAWGQARFAFDSTAGTLPKDVVPSRYALWLDLDPQAPGFSGVATITLTVRRPVAAITLNAQQLSASGATLTAEDGSTQALALSEGEAPQTWRLQPVSGQTIAAGEYRLSIAYSGVVQSSARGLYRVRYRTERGPAQMLATQLEAVFARMLFPAFDEPAFRAAFELTVQAPEGYQVLSNMPGQRDADGAAASDDVPAPPPGWQRVRFLPTPAMPSYLVAVAVGRFDALEGSAAGVPLRILSAEGKRELGREALKATEQLLPFYTDYFGLPYALPKLDQLAVPAVRNGAMEDWGLISYAESNLLFDPARSSAGTQRRVFGIAAHELAHQWFGNLVTAAWWDELWLNEAFATWLAAKAVDRFHPEWQAALQRRARRDATMARDAGDATRAIRGAPAGEAHVFDLVDNITYDKGGAVLSMLEQWLGPETFREGLRRYIDGQRMSNATAGDLWHHLSAASGQDVASVAASWTDQPGFPLVQLSARCEGGRTQVRLRQQRFSLQRRPLPAQHWKIPLVLARGTEQQSLLLEAPEQSLVLEGCPAAPLRANAGGHGYLRVDYGRDGFAALARGFADLPAADRLGLLSDSFALAQAGRLPMADYLRLLDKLPALEDPARGPLLSAAMDLLGFLDQALAGTPAGRRLRAWARARLKPVLDGLGWEPVAGEDEASSDLRAALIERLARWEDEGVIREATRRFDAQQLGGPVLPASIRASVVSAVGVHPDRAHFETLRQALLSATGEEDRWLHANALAGGRDPARARELLALSLDERLPPNVATALPGLISRGSPNGALAYDFTVRHWKALAARAGTMYGAEQRLLPAAARGFNQRWRARRLRADQRALGGAAGRLQAASAARGIELRAQLRERQAGALFRALSAGH